MHNKDLWTAFPTHLHPPAIRSLSLLFILQELEAQFQQIQSIKTSPQELNRFFSQNSPFPQMGDCPDKLCFYCAVLLQASKIREHSVTKELDEMRAIILQYRSKHPIPTVQFCEVFYQKLVSFFSSLIPFIVSARTDENILLKLIEQRKIFNEHLGENTIETLLQRLFPRGYQHLHSTIQEGFTRRGFSSFFAEKEHLIEEIEWENPCLVTAELS